MEFDALEPRVVAIVAVAALVPAAWYVLGRLSAVSAVAVVNVLVIAGSLWVAMRPTASTHAASGH